MDNDKLPARDLSGQAGSNGRVVKVQCFPLYSILLALNRTNIDFFSLDIELHERFVLKTIPFHKLNITLLAVETIRGHIKIERELLDAAYNEIVDHMELQGYGLLHPKKSGDVFFIKKDFVERMQL